MNRTGGGGGGGIGRCNAFPVILGEFALYCRMGGGGGGGIRATLLAKGIAFRSGVEIKVFS